MPSNNIGASALRESCIRPLWNKSNSLGNKAKESPVCNKVNDNAFMQQPKGKFRNAFLEEEQSLRNRNVGTSEKPM